MDATKMVGAFCVAVALTSCAAVDTATQDSNVVESDPQRVFLGEYAMCLSPVDPDEEDQQQIDDAFVDMPLPNLETIRFLAHASSIAYAPPSEIGPELERLGFGAPGDGAWLQACAQDVAVLEASTAAYPFSEPQLSPCALGWYEANEGSVEEFALFAHGTVHHERGIEFFSAEYAVGVEETILTGSTQVVWAQHATAPLVVVAFRGTEFPDPADLWTDAAFFKNPYYFGEVHGGFDDALATVRGILDERLATIDGETQIWVTGHSLGGALASLFTAELLHRVDQGADLRVGGMVTYGSPRVGDDAFFAATEALAAEQRVPLHRVANISNDIVGFDPVTHVPFRHFGPEFGHVGAPLKLTDDGTIEYALEPSRFILPLGFLEEAIDYFKEQVAQILSDAFPHALAQYRARIDTAIASGRYDDLQQCGAHDGAHAADDDDEGPWWWPF